jgi:hypothetical protein
MKWVTREHVKVDRGACPWLIQKFIDPQADFRFVPADMVQEMASREDTIPFDVPGVELGHQGGKCSFEAIVAKCHVDDPAIQLLAKIVHGADVAQNLYGRPEAAGLKAVAIGFGLIGLKNDHEILDREFVVYDALYAYCQKEVASAVEKRLR